MCDTAIGERVSLWSHIINMEEGKQRPGWDEQRQKEQARRQINLQDNVQHYAASLVQRINDPSARNADKQTQQLGKKITHEIQSNICSICLELMVPPLHNPILIFPCGHNICKDCLFEHPPQGQLKQNLKLKLQKCSLCRQKIESYALNQSLMTLICTYTNNKHLLKEQPQQDQPQQQEEEVQNSQKLKARCGILQKELLALSAENEQYSRSKAVLHEVIETLKREKKKVDREMEKTEEEGRLIGKCLSQKVQEMQFLQKQLRQAEDRSRVIGKALQPLLKQKERQQVMLVSQLLQKK